MADDAGQRPGAEPQRLAAHILLDVLSVRFDDNLSDADKEEAAWLALDRMVDVGAVIPATLHTDDGPVPGAVLGSPTVALVLLDTLITAIADNTGRPATDLIVELRDVVDTHQW